MERHTGEGEAEREKGRVEKDRELLHSLVQSPKWSQWPGLSQGRAWSFIQVSVRALVG